MMEFRHFIVEITDKKSQFSSEKNDRMIKNHHFDMSENRHLYHDVIPLRRFR